MTFTATAFRFHGTAFMDSARQIREAVFCVEQNIPAALEWDEHDATAEHFLLTDGQTPIGTARIRPYGDNLFKIERMAVLKAHRTNGAGAFLLRAVMMHLKGTALVLNAQTSAEGFYRKHGFTPQGAVFAEAGIPHIRMTRQA